jgi:hypothetical protein
MRFSMTRLYQARLRAWALGASLLAAGGCGSGLHLGPTPGALQADPGVSLLAEARFGKAVVLHALLLDSVGRPLPNSLRRTSLAGHASALTWPDANDEATAVVAFLDENANGMCDEATLSAALERHASSPQRVLLGALGVPSRVGCDVFAGAPLAEPAFQLYLYAPSTQTAVLRLQNESTGDVLVDRTQTLLPGGQMVANPLQKNQRYRLDVEAAALEPLHVSLGPIWGDISLGLRDIGASL